MSPDVRKIVETAIRELEIHQSRAGCNDMEVPNTDEMRQLWLECEAWNLGVDVADLDKMRDEWMPFPESDKETVTVHDSLSGFLLRKITGTLGKRG